MEWLIILAMGVALYQLWRRIERLEERLAMQEMLARVPIVPPLPAQRDAQPEPPPITAAPVIAPPALDVPRPATVPAVRRTIARVVGAAAARTGSSAVPAAPAARSASPDPHASRPLSVNFEELFGRRLPIWAGGITLAIAGFFLVAYAIDLGLLSPFVRVLLGFAFGAGLLKAAFLAERMKDKVDDPRVPQALAGAGLATLYACFYLAGSEYGLIGSGLAFLGLAGVTVAAVWLSYRFGLPCAVIGLIGGFAAPMIVDADEANLPLLSIYLALVSGGLALTGRRQGRGWLGQAALIGGLLWGLLLTLSQDLGFADQLFVGLYLVAMGAGLPAIVGELPSRAWLRAGAGGFAALQLAALIDRGDYALLTWGLFGLLAAALAVLGWRERALRDASVLATAVAALLLAFWPDPAVWQFALVAGGLAVVLAGAPLAHVWRGTAQRGDVVQLAGAAPAFGFAAIWQFGNLFSEFDPVLAAALLALAALPAAAAWRSGHGDWRRWLFETSAAGTLVLALSAVVSMEWGATTYAIAALVVAFALPGRIAAARTLAAATAWFAAWPLTMWLDAGGNALWGTRFALIDIAPWWETLRYLVPGVVAGLIVAWRGAPFARSQTTRAIAAAAGIGGAIAAHSLYKLVFAIGSDAQFVTLGLAERTVWEALLVAGAAGLWQLHARFAGARIAAAALAGAALAHFAWFSLLLHNPLWTAQAVGPVPLANLVTASFAVAIAALLVLHEVTPATWRPGIAIAIMVLLPVLAITLLRQAFGGTLLNDGALGEGEDLLRSLAGIVLAALYLWWGARAGDRLWRIGSLALMLLAVGKVFLLDAAVLSGLARIASFLALGFSLIGIGWFYARVLARAAAEVRPAAIPEQDMPSGGG